MATRKESLIFLAMAVLLAAIYFSPALFMNCTFLGSDIAAGNPLFDGIFTPVKGNNQTGDFLPTVYPREFFFNHMLHRGIIPLWNPHLFGGNAYVPDSRVGVFYPPRMLLHWLLPTHQALDALRIIHTLMAGFTMFLLASSFGWSLPARCFSAIIWMFSGLAGTWLETNDVLPINAYFPIIFLYFRKSLLDRGFRYVLPAGIFLGIYLLAAQQQFSFYLGLMLLLYAVFLAMKRDINWLHGITRGLMIILISLCLSAIQTVPMLHDLSFLHRISFSWDELVRLRSVPLWTVVMLLICPDIMGHPATGIYFLPRGDVLYHEICLYCSIIALPFAFLAALRRRGDYSVFTLAVIAGLLAASATCFYYPFFTFIPLLSKLLPGRIVLIIIFSIAILAGAGMDLLIRDRGHLKTVLWAFGALLLFYLCLFASTIMLQYRPELFISPLKAGFQHILYLFKSTQRKDIYIEYVQAVANYYNPLNLWLFLPGLMALSALVTLYIKPSRNNRIPVFWILAGLTAFELLSFSLRYNPLSVRSEAVAPPPVVWLQAQQKPFRVLNQSSDILQNLFSVFQIDTVEGDQSMYPLSYHELMCRLESRFNGKAAITFGTRIKLHGYDSPVLDMLNTRYIIFPSDPKPLPAHIEKVYDGSVKIYRNKKAMDRAFLVNNYTVMSHQKILDQVAAPDFNPSLRAFIEKEPVFPPDTGSLTETDSTVIREYTPHQIVVEARCRTKSLLVISDSFFPGWEAAVDGKPAPILCTDYAFRGIALGRGHHTIVMRYRPLPVIAGMWISFITIFLIGAAFFARQFNLLKNLPGRVEQRCTESPE